MEAARTVCASLSPSSVPFRSAPSLLCCSDQLPASLESCSPIKLVCFHWKHIFIGLSQVLWKYCWFGFFGGIEKGGEFRKKRRGQADKAKSSWILLSHRAGVITSSVDCRTENISVRGMCLKNGKVTVGCGANCPPSSCSDGCKVGILSSVLIWQGQSLLETWYS